MGAFVQFHSIEINKCIFLTNYNFHAIIEKKIYYPRIYGLNVIDPIWMGFGRTKYRYVTIHTSHSRCLHVHGLQWYR